MLQLHALLEGVAGIDLQTFGAYNQDITRGIDETVAP